MEAVRRCAKVQICREANLSPKRKKRGTIHKSDSPTGAITDVEHAEHQAQAKKFARATPNGESDGEEGETLSQARARYELFIQFLYDAQSPEQLSNVEANRTPFRMQELQDFVTQTRPVVSLNLIGITRTSCERWC